MTNNLVRVYVDADKKQVFIFCNGTQVASWSNCAWGQGVSVGASFHDVDSSLEIIQNTPMNDKGFGGWREWGMLMVREGGTIYSRYNSGWETARATEWITKGSKTVTLKMVKFTRYGMAGCYRRDFMIYEQHPHSGNVGDIHPEGWVWYSANGGFSNYSPYGGSFKRVSTKTNRWVTNNYLKIEANAGGRAC